MIEGGPDIAEQNDLAACLRSANSCSAAGPMQFTTGQNGRGNPKCNKCPSKSVQRDGCPNAWAIYGNGGNPCNYRDALDAAARKLKADGKLTGDDPSNQYEGILKAGYHYYGSKAAIGRLGNCSYGEFVYKHCVPSYICKGNR